MVLDVAEEKEQLVATHAVGSGWFVRAYARSITAVSIIEYRLVYPDGTERHLTQDDAKVLTAMRPE